MSPLAYRELLRIARRCARRTDEADDLVQDALLEAAQTGRTDFSDPRTRSWLGGVIRNKAALAARTAVRRRRRETDWHSLLDADERAESGDLTDTLAGLPPALKSVAALALTGHSRREIAYLLQLPDTALRQRLTALRRRLAGRGIAMPTGTPGLNLDLAYGRIRDALLPELLRQHGVFASHDPDGHLFIVRRTGPAHKPAIRGN